jgi:eukaryotic-like serine/threonine-protein kinase
VPATPSIHAFGSFRLDPAERLLLRDDQSVSLTPKAFDLLIYLVERSGRLVTKQELLTGIWPDTFVEESNLAYTVSALRKALGDGTNGEHFIQTVPTRGYRFVAPVTQIEPRKPTDGAVSVTHRRAAILAAVLLTLITAMLVVSHVRAPDNTAAVSRFALPLPGPGIVRVSPDGRRMAFVPAAFVAGPTGASVWLRDIDAPVTREAQRIEGTQGALWLFWAPDSQQLAFGTASALKKLSLSDGTIQTLCDPCQPAGEGTWSRAGLIVFPEEEGSLLAIPVDGGAPHPVTSVDRADGEIRHASPYFLPDGRRFLYVIRNEDPSRSGVYVGDLTSGTPKRLLDGDTTAVFAPPGYLLFWRAGTLMAQPFDDRRLALAGEARTLIPESRFIRFWPLRQAVSISDRGMLMYSVAEEPESQFRWVSRTGALQRVVEEPARYYTFALSADGERLVFSQVETGRRDHLWEVDLNRGRRLRRTFGESSYADPRWMDAQRLLAMRWPDVSIVRLDRDGKESAITAPSACVLDDVSHDGRYLLCRTGPGRRELHAVPLEGESGASTLVRAAPAGIIDQTRFSPDGQWIAYHANESGRLEVYVAPFASNAEARPVSTDGGVQPYWGDDGRELYYLDLQGALHAVEWRPEREPPFSDPVRLFETGIVAPSAVVEQYAGGPGGDRFLLLKPVDDKVRHSVQVVINWPALLQHAR